MSAQEEYRRKLVSADEAAAAIHSGDVVVKGMAVAEPPALLRAIARRADAGELDDLRLYYNHSMSHAAETVLRYELMDRIHPKCAFPTAVERRLIRLGLEDGGRKVVDVVPVSFAQFPRLLRDTIAVDAAVLTVSPMDRHGFFTFGTNNDYGSTAARHCRRLIVEVNPRMPRINGQTNLHVSEVDLIVEHDEPLLEGEAREPAPEAERIAAYVVELIADGATLQMGVGSIPDAICRYLADYRDLGIHTECLTPGLVDLVRRGAVTGASKTLHPRKVVFTFTIGTREIYDFLDDNLFFESYPADYVIDPAVIARNERMISINSAIEVDLYGQANAEWLNGHQYSATGGQLDFVRGAYAAKDGKSILALMSTAGGGRFSRIVSHIEGPITDTRMDTHYVVTEHGVANLKGKSSSERARALIAIAHPAFRERLAAEAKARFLV